MTIMAHTHTATIMCAQQGTVSFNFRLLEDGSFRLLENGSFRLLN
jgi:hypothetical protein